MSPRPHKVSLTVSTEQATVSVNLTRRRTGGWNEPAADTSALTGELHQALTALESIITRME